LVDFTSPNQHQPDAAGEEWFDFCLGGCPRRLCGALCHLRETHGKEVTTRDQAVAAAGSAVISGAVALMIGAITTRSQMNRFKTEERAKSEREREKKRIQYELPEMERFWRRGGNQFPVPSTFTISVNLRNGKE